MAEEQQSMEDKARGVAEKAKEAVGGGGSGGGTVLSALKSKEVLVPAAISAVGAVAAAKGPSLLRRLSDDAAEKGEEGAMKLGRTAAESAKDAISGGGGMRGLAGKAVSKAFGGGDGGDGDDGGKKTRRLPIERWTDVAVPVEKAYEAWTKFDQYPKFMHRVQSVQRAGTDRVRWQEKIWFSTRSWEGKITDRRENERIAWKTNSGMSHRGVVTFHRLSDNLTRVMVTMEFEPQGIMEKMASGLRFVKRAVESDLARFKAFVEMEEARGVEYRSAKDDGEDGGGRDRSDDKDEAEREEERRERESRRSERRQVGAGQR